MLMSTVVAIALGVAPVKQDGTVTGDYSAVVGRYSQSVDRHGTTHISGFNRLTGTPYDLALDNEGNVEARVGDSIIAFHVQDAG